MATKWRWMDREGRNCRGTWRNLWQLVEHQCWSGSYWRDEGVFCDASQSHPTPWLIYQHSHHAPSQWHHGSTLLDVSKLKFFHIWRTGWTMKDRVNHDSSVKSTLDHCSLVHARGCWTKARQAVQLACASQGLTAGHLECRFASWSQLWITWLLKQTLPAVCSCVLMAVAVFVLFLIDVRTTKRFW